MTMNRFFHGKDAKGNLVISMPPTDVDVLQLTAGAARLYEIPANTQFVFIGCSKDFYARFGDDSALATLPTGDSLTGRGPMMNPGLVTITEETHISLLCESTTPIFIHRWR